MGQQADRKTKLTQIKNSVIEQGYIKVVDPNLQVRLQIGLQTDGTYTIRSYNSVGGLLNDFNSLTGGGSPSGAAGGALSGTYPNPTITALSASHLAGGTAPAGTYEFPTLTTGGVAVVVTTDGRLTNARTPVGTTLTSGQVFYGSGGIVAAGTPNTAGIVDTSTAQSVAGAKTLSSLLTVTASVQMNNGGISYSLTGATTPAFAGSVSGDSVNRFILQANGQMQWGPGSGAVDVTLARASTANLTLTATTFNSSASVPATNDSSTNVPTTAFVTPADQRGRRLAFFMGGS